MVKAYNEMNDEEKKKLHAFLLGRNISINNYNFAMLLGFGIAIMAFITGLLLAIVGTNILSTGVLSTIVYGVNSSTTINVINASYKIMQLTPLIVFSGLIGFVLIFVVSKYSFEKTKKVDYLIFGYDSIKDACEISKTEVEDLKKTYKKVKK